MSGEPLPRFSRWRPFPDPRRGEMLTAPFGPGLYELRRGDTKRGVCFGRGSHCAERMSSLLPVPLGKGKRNNAAKRQYIRRNMRHIEYRTAPCRDRAHSVVAERVLKATRTDWIFST